MALTLDVMRRFAVARSLFPPTTLEAALERLGFVQADPIRAPARAQDLTLRPRVAGYRAGDLERRYASLDVEEDMLVNYGFVSRAVYALMHPRSGMAPWNVSGRRRSPAVLDFVRSRGTVHPREVDDHFAHGRVTNYWGGSSNATTHLLDQMHYCGLLRVARREGGIRIYAARDPAESANHLTLSARLDRLIDVVVRAYAPLPGSGLSTLVRRLRYGVPQANRLLPAAIDRAKRRLSHARIDGADWYWPADEAPATALVRDAVRLLAPFDPVVWDRRRFETLWGWAYRFEAYTPAALRVRGYYALPLLWRDHVVGWGNLSIEHGRLRADIGYAAGQPPRDRRFARALDAELNRMRAFLGLGSKIPAPAGGPAVEDPP